MAVLLLSCCPVRQQQQQQRQYHHWLLLRIISHIFVVVFVEAAVNSMPPSSSSSIPFTAVAIAVLQQRPQQQLCRSNRHRQPHQLYQYNNQQYRRRRIPSPISLSPISVAHFSRNRGGRFSFTTPKWLIDILQQSSSSSELYASEYDSTLQKGEEEIDPGMVEGTNLRIVKYPHAALRAPNAMITMEELQSEKNTIGTIAREMFLIMYAAQGVGLAAPQVGINKRLMIFNESGDRTKWINEVILINPIITATSDTTDIETEGCLSFPNMNGHVERNKWIKVEAWNLKGKTIRKKYTGWEARIFQHEYDHLNGIVYIDRLIDDEQKQTVCVPRLQELIQQHDTTLHGEPAL